MALEDRQQRFVEEYLIDLNATQAAIRAGYAPRTANRQGARLLSKADIQAAIEAAKAERSARTLVTADQVIKALVNIAFSDRRKIASWGADGITFRESSALTDEQAQLVQSFSQTRTQHGGTIRVDLCDRMAAIKLLGEHLGLFDDLDKVKREIEELKKLVQRDRGSP